MLKSDKVKSSEGGKQKLREAMKDAELSQTKLAEKARVGIDTIKRLLGTKSCPNGVERWQVENLAKELNILPTDIVEFKDWDGGNSAPYPEEFKSLIEEKTGNFCGRDLVFQRFNDFLLKEKNGYFTLVGDAGMGKSSIAAKYVLDKSAICYFNIMAERRNRPEKFLESVRQQLINRYDLENAERDELAALLEKTRKKLGDNPLVIVVDALDEVEDEPGANNILNLPKFLPAGVYFFLTRRPYSSGEKRLVVEVYSGELNLSHEADDEIKKMNRDDVKAYIRFFLEEDPEHKDKLREWIESSKIAVVDFVDLLAEKSEYNFMYLRYVLPAIAKGDYNDLSIKELPDGLLQYYEQHWERMGMTGKNRENAVLLSILVEARTPVSSKLIADAARRDEYEVVEVLEKWRGFLKKERVEGQECYSPYHYTFAEFLQQKPAIKKEAAKLLAAKNNRIREALTADEGEGDEEE